MVFPEALESEEFAAFRAALDVPLLANMTEFGKSPLLSAQRSKSLGVNIVIYPVTLLRLAMGAASDGLDEILQLGHAGGPAAADADARTALRPARLLVVQPLRRRRVQLQGVARSSSGAARCVIRPSMEAS